MQVATLVFVYPCLLAIYFGEAAYLAVHPEHYAQAFYKAVPERLFWPAFVIATSAALVGSQSLISSAFSVLRLSARLHCFPPLKARPDMATLPHDLICMHLICIGRLSYCTSAAVPSSSFTCAPVHADFVFLRTSGTLLPHIITSL